MEWPPYHPEVTDPISLWKLNVVRSDLYMDERPPGKPGAPGKIGNNSA